MPDIEINDYIFFSWFLQQLPEEGNDTDHSDPETLTVIIRHENIVNYYYQNF